jgi:hypothetical protein
MTTSSEINAQIYNVAPTFFEAVRSEVLERATHAATIAERVANQQRLEAAVAAVLTEAIPQDLDHDQLWQVLWRRIVYAGTRASKATREIESMHRLVPLFQDLANYVPGRYVFDKNEWHRFVERWRARYATPTQKANWLSLSKDEPDWDPARDFAHGVTTPEVWRILIKDEQTYPGLKFSSLASKVEKYVAVAQFLHDQRVKHGPQALAHYLKGNAFSPQHLEGDAWVRERLTLAEVRDRFEVQVGLLTALHTMMDLGLKTIKPDRVMTWLFSQLGWLKTLPESLPKERVVGNYLRPDVVEEMTVRADVFAASLDRAGYQQAHRLLDIWMVKFGQDPELDWGIAVNLQDGARRIRAVLEGVKAAALEVPLVSATQAATKWPTVEYLPIQMQVGATKGPSGGVKLNRRQSPIVMTRDEAGKRFRKQWLAGRAVHPDIYPDRVPGIPNEPKERILRKIERGVDPERAFLFVLRPDEDA